MLRTPPTPIQSNDFLELIRNIHACHDVRSREPLDWGAIFTKHGYTLECHDIDFSLIPDHCWQWFIDYSYFKNFTFINCKVGGNQFDRCTFHSSTFVKQKFLFDFTNCLLFQANKDQENNFLEQCCQYRSHSNVIINLDETQPLILIVYTPSHGTSYTDILYKRFIDRDMNVVKIYSDELLTKFTQKMKPDHPIFYNLQYIHGIILPGGDNVITDPAAYTDREMLEHYLVTLSLDHSIPLFGVCRGHQFVGHYFGATLKDINEHQEGVIDIVTDNRSKLYQLAKKKYDSQEARGKKPELEISEDGFTYQTLCNHYQALFFKRNLPSQIIVTAKARDGLTEGLQIKDHIITFQHHHEDRNEYSFARATIKLFSQMVTKYQQNKNECQRAKFFHLGFGK